MSLVSLATKYKDVLTIGFSVLSFMIACTSLFFSGRTAWHDRARLKITGRVVYEPVYEKAYKIEVIVLNVGRRDAVVEGILCHYENGKTSYQYEKDGVMIKEKQRKKFELDYFDIIYTDHEGEVHQLENITLLDIERKEHEIPNSHEIVSSFIKNR